MIISLLDINNCDHISGMKCSKDMKTVGHEVLEGHEDGEDVRAPHLHSHHDHQLGMSDIDNCDHISGMNCSKDMKTEMVCGLHTCIHTMITSLSDIDNCDHISGMKCSEDMKTERITGFTPAFPP